MRAVPAAVWAAVVILATAAAVQGTHRMVKGSWALRAAAVFPVIGLPAPLLARHAVFATGQSVALCLILLAYLLADRPAAVWRSPARAAGVLACLTLAAFHTSITIWVAIIPLIAVAALHATAGPSVPVRRGSALLVIIALAATLLSKVALAGVALAGGFTVPGLGAVFAPFEHLPPHAASLVECFLLQLGVDFFGLNLSAESALGVLRVTSLPLLLLGVRGGFCAVKGTVKNAWRSAAYPGNNSVRHRILPGVLAAGFVINVTEYMLSTLSVNVEKNDSSRFLIPAVVYGSVLAGRVAVPALQRLAASLCRSAPTPGAALVVRRSLPLLAVLWVLMYLGPFLQRIRGPFPAGPEQELTRWLQSRGLTDGYGAYWSASLVTATSNNQVRIRAVVFDGRGFMPFHWYSRRDWYDRPGVRFLVFNDGNDRVGFANINRDAATRAFGAPAQEHHVGIYTVLVWDQDLSPMLRRP